MVGTDQAKSLWAWCIRPHSTDEDIARREQVTKAILLSLALVAGIFLVIAILGHIRGTIPLDTVFLLTCMMCVFGGGWWLAHAGGWRISGYFPSILAFLSAAYGNWIGGIDAPGNLLYVLAILVTALLQGGWSPLVMLLLSLVAYLGLAFAHGVGYLHRMRSYDAAFANRVIIIVATLIGITVVLNLLVAQFRKALVQSRNHANQARANANALAIFKALADNAVDAFFISDLDGKLTYANPTFSRLFGYDPVANPETKTETFFPKGILKEAGLDTSQDSFQGWKGEARLKRVDGTEFDADLSVFRLRDLDGEPKGKAVIVRDVTERNRAQKALLESETQLRQAQKMEAVGELAGGVAHDFNNILQAIIGYADLAKNRSETADAPSAELDEIIKAAERASMLTRQLLAFSRRQIIKPTPLDLNEVIENLLRMIRRMIGERIELVFSPAPVVKTVMADRGQIEQVLMNLCVNARDAMPEGGRLTIETQNRVVDEKYCAKHESMSPGEWVVLTVKDSGSGMDAETLTRIFEPFFTTKEVGKGTGLGLAMVYGIVKQHGGFVSTESQVGCGTTFTVRLPTVDAAPSEPPSAKTNAPRGGTETILLAEDEDQVRTQAKLVLESAGYTVLSAADGEEALRIYGENARSVDLLLLDAVMPRLDGRAVYEAIRLSRPSVRCIFATGYSEDSFNGLDSPENPPYVLHKPHRSHDLLSTVRRILDS